MSDLEDIENAKRMTRILFSDLWEEAIHPHVQAALGSLRPSLTTVPSRLLHFTGPSAVLSILKEKKLRLYRAKAANDPLEIEYGTGIAQECVERLPASDLKSILSSPDGTGLMLDPHVACFTEESSQEDLLHWALYGRNGTGMALVFNGKALAANSAKADLVRVSYDRDEHEKMMGAVLKHAESAFEAARHAAQRRGMPADNVLKSIRGFSDIFPMFAAAMKRAAFAPEKEWRLCVSHVPKGSEGESMEFGADASGPVLRTFFAIQFDPRALTEIIVSPEYAELNEPALRMLLPEYGFDGVKVRRMSNPIIRAPFVSR